MKLKKLKSLIIEKNKLDKLIPFLFLKHREALEVPTDIKETNKQTKKQLLIDWNMRDVLHKAARKLKTLDSSLV